MVVCKQSGGKTHGESRLIQFNGCTCHGLRVVRATLPSGGFYRLPATDRLGEAQAHFSGSHFSYQVISHFLFSLKFSNINRIFLMSSSGILGMGAAILIRLVPPGNFPGVQSDCFNPHTPLYGEKHRSTTRTTRSS